jgi:chromosome segregation ATPase
MGDVILVNTRTMKNLGLLTALMAILIAFSSCNSKKIDRLEAERARLQADSLAKDSVLNEWFTSFNEIEENLAEISDKQEFITDVASSESPSVPDIREQIQLEIKAIQEIMAENDTMLEKLKNQLHSSNIKIKALEETIVKLNQRIEEKDLEIIELREKLIALNIEIESLDQMISNLEKEKQEQQEIIQQKVESINEHNKVWYVVGTTKYLKDNEIIEKTGFLGSAKKLNDQAETGLFTMGDKRELTSININSEKADLITTHPDGSYEFVTEGKVITSLTINNPELFWKASNYCVIETK